MATTSVWGSLPSRSRCSSDDSSSLLDSATPLRHLDDMDALCSSHPLQRAGAPAAAVTASGRLQAAAQRAVLNNTPLKLLVLAEEHGVDGCFQGMLASNLLALALQAGCSVKTLEALLRCGSDANGHVLLKNEKGEPARAVLPLLYAAERHDVAAVQCLLAAGADPLDAGDTGDMTPLEEAATSSDAALLRLMLEHACKLHTKETLIAIASRRPSVAGVLLPRSAR